MEFQENLHVFKKVRIEFLFVVIRCVFDTYYKKVLLFLLLFFSFCFYLVASKIRYLQEYHNRVLHNIYPVPSGTDIANTLKYFSQTLLR